MYTPQKTWLPTKGLGQTCPNSLDANGNVVDCNGNIVVPAMSATLPVSSIGPAFANIGGSGFQCYNASTGTYYNCSVSGTPTGLTPAGTGPNTVPVVTNSSWIVLAAVLGGLVLFAAVVR